VGFEPGCSVPEADAMSTAARRHRAGVPAPIWHPVHSYNNLVLAIADGLVTHMSIHQYQGYPRYVDAKPIPNPTFLPKSSNKPSEKTGSSIFTEVSDAVLGRHNKYLCNINPCHHYPHLMTRTPNHLHLYIYAYLVESP
jgi:hypothetical protein